MDIFGPLQWTRSSNKFLVIISDEKSKLTWEISSTVSTSTQLANIFQVMGYPLAIPDTILWDCGQQFVRPCFTRMLACLGEKKLTNTAYYFQNEKLAERYNPRLVPAPGLYVMVSQRDWDQYVQLLTYVKKTRTHRSRTTWPYLLTLSRHPSGPTTIYSPSFSSADAYKSTGAQVLRIQLLETFGTMKNKFSATIQKPKLHNKRHFDLNRRRFPESQPGQHVYAGKPLMTAPGQERRTP